LVAMAPGDFWGEIVFKQFQKGGLDTPRYELWQAMLTHFFDDFWGGRHVLLAESYAHNLWLDVLWDAGIPAFTLWASFHLYHFFMWAVLISRTKSVPARFVLVGIGVSFLLSFMVEPVNVASQYYIWASLAFFGAIARMYGTQKAAAG
jgi:hypothetical protein